MTAPDGARWHVGRQWVSYRVRRRRIDMPDSGGLGDLGADDVLVAIGLIFFGLFLIFMLFTFVVPLVVMGVELIVLLLLLFWGVASRVVLRRPWTIRARAGDGRQLTWKAKGFLRSGRVRDEAAAALARGEARPQPPEALPATS